MQSQDLMKHKKPRKHKQKKSKCMDVQTTCDEPNMINNEPQTTCEIKDPVNEQINPLTNDNCEENEENQHNPENEENTAHPELQQKSRKPQKYEQSKTILRKLSAKANVKSLSTECYPLILNIIHDVVNLIASKLLDKKPHKKTISVTDIEPIIQQFPSNCADLENSKNIDETNIPVFTRTAFKRQLKRSLDDKFRISPMALKLLQQHVETIITNILCVAQNISTNANRKRVFKKDIELAWQMHIKYQQD